MLTKIGNSAKVIYFRTVTASTLSTVRGMYALNLNPTKRLYQCRIMGMPVAYKKIKARHA